MSKYTLKQLDRNNKHDYKFWKNGLKNFNGATIFHNPGLFRLSWKKFHEYHLGIFKGEELFGILPLAILENENKKEVKSPYGSSYGGFVFRDILNYSDSKIVEKFIEFTKRFEYKLNSVLTSLPVYHEHVRETSDYCGWRARKFDRLEQTRNLSSCYGAYVFRQCHVRLVPRLFSYLPRLQPSSLLRSCSSANTQTVATDFL